LRESRTAIESDVRERVTAARACIERTGRLTDRAYEDKLEGKISDACSTSLTEWCGRRSSEMVGATGFEPATP
jgi:hypothetical protein